MPAVSSHKPEETHWSKKGGATLSLRGSLEKIDFKACNLFLICYNKFVLFH
jgi:hypothetical protein